MYNFAIEEGDNMTEKIQDIKQKTSEPFKTSPEDKVKNIENKLINIFKEYGCLNDIGDITDDDLTFFKDLTLTVNKYFFQKYR